MVNYPITFGRTDLRWLGRDGSEHAQREKGDYIFRSAMTDEAQTMLEEQCFLGSYVRYLSTGRCETEHIALGILSIAESCRGIVGVTLEGLVTYKAARKIIGYDSGRILYELLLHNGWESFHVSAESEVVIPDFSSYDETMVYSVGVKCTKKSKSEKSEIDGETPIDGKIRVTPKYDPANSAIHHQVEKIKAKVYIELKPGFVAKLASSEMRYGPWEMKNYRAMAQKEKRRRAP